METLFSLQGLIFQLPQGQDNRVVWHVWLLSFLGLSLWSAGLQGAGFVEEEGIDWKQDSDRRGGKVGHWQRPGGGRCMTHSVTRSEPARTDLHCFQPRLTPKYRILTSPQDGLGGRG